MQATVVATLPVVTAFDLYFEEMVIGQEFQSAYRKVTAFDVQAFATLTGDINPIHLNDAVASVTPFRKRIAHGALVFSLATGLAYQMGLVKGTVIFDSISMDFKRPVFIDDSIYLRLVIAKLEEVRRPATSGKATLQALIFNHNDKLIQEGTWTAFVTRRR